ncbi:uncharacterized protein LOC120205774 [Hibiscus syriacus]|uniref:uncharacterized protein LOC120205774 n=1 Tax=Hibiscus syriacus TaxID=106335 RepID=UPI00192455A7|nr:uncharacterized protein LOC120205774 [Hibiscus syriacus]
MTLVDKCYNEYAYRTSDLTILLDEFKNKYIGDQFIVDMKQEFLSLKWGNRTMYEYECEFNKLILFASEMTPDEKVNCNLFIQGLRSGLREYLLDINMSTLQEVINRAKGDNSRKGRQYQSSAVGLGRSSQYPPCQSWGKNHPVAIVQSPRHGDANPHINSPLCYNRDGKERSGLNLPKPIQLTGYNKDQCKDYTCTGACQKTDGKLSHCYAMINENTNSIGSLRYALHLRFLCPSPKSFLRCKSDLGSVTRKTKTDRDGDQFYLYNDLRVVFPQRHSDADEGKLNVEYHYPDHPRYLDIRN